MKIRYDAETDILTIVLKDDVSVVDSEEGKRGVVVDYEAEGNIIGIEVVDASQLLKNPASLVTE